MSSSFRPGHIGKTLLAAVSDKPLWLSILGCVIVGLAWSALSDIRFHSRMALIVLGLLAVNAAYRRFRPGPANPVAVMIETLAALVAFTAVWAPITYLSARNSHPLIDPTLSWLDHLMGFDWDSWRSFIEGMPTVNLMLHLVYASLEPQAVVAIAYLPLVKGGRRGLALARQGMVAGALTSLLFWCFPAMGAQAAEWTADLTALRGTAPLSFELVKLKGIVSFPSFHTVLGLLFIYAFRGTHLVLPAIVVNVLMIVSALNVGSHYLTDIVGGVVVAAIAILAVEWLETLRFTRPANPPILAKSS